MLCKTHYRYICGVWAGLTVHHLSEASDPSAQRELQDETVPHLHHHREVRRATCKKRGDVRRAMRLTVEMILELLPLATL